jgi:hypothetical protein
MRGNRWLSNFHSLSNSCMTGSRNTSISMSGYWGPDIRTVRKRYFLFWHNHVGMLYMVRITGQVLWSLILTLKGFIPLVLKANRTFLGSELNSLLLSSKSFHWLPSAECAITSSSTLRSSSHHVMSAASLGFRKIRLKRSIIGRYHITKAGTLLFLASLPNGASSGGWDSYTAFFCTIISPLIPYRGFSSTVKVIVLVPAGPQRGHLSRSLNVTTKKDTMVGTCMDFFQHPLPMDL